MTLPNPDSDGIDFGHWESEGHLNDDAPQLAYRPLLRPPIAMLVAFDDVSQNGEIFRVRKDRFTIGRQSCDCNIDHDPQIASPHIEIARRHIEGGFQWWLQDVSTSKNGFFVRAKSYKLEVETEIFLGSRKYLFRPVSIESGGVSHESNFSDRLADGSIPGPSVFDKPIGYPSFGTCSEESSRKIWLISGDYWVGRSPNCEFVVKDDPYLAAKHMLIHCEEGKIRASTDRVRNGMWIKHHRIRVDKTCTFQVGEQRFRLYIGET